MPRHENLSQNVCSPLCTSDIFDAEDSFEMDNIDSSTLSITEKDELVEQALYTWQHKRNGNSNYNANRRNFRQNFNNNNNNNRYGAGNATSRRNVPSFKAQTQGPIVNSQGPKVNPRDLQAGEIMRCHGCDSRFHLYRSVKCPNNMKAMIAEENVHDNLKVETIYASENDFKPGHQNTCGFGVIDSAATKTVCGKPWFDSFKNYLSSIGKNISTSPSNTSYRFGNDGQKKSLFAANIPVNLFGKHIVLTVDVIS